MLDITLLLADDEEELLENLVYDLKKEVKNIKTAGNGAEALKMIKEGGIDCVLSDIKMPQKNGLVFAKEAREHGFNLPIIFLTAHGDDELMKKALALGAFDFINKPYERENLINIIKEAALESIKIQEGQAKKTDSDFEHSYIKMVSDNSKDD